MDDIRQGRCEFADYYGNKHEAVWTVGIDARRKKPEKELIKKTDIWLLQIMVDGELCVRFERGTYFKHLPLFNPTARKVHKMVLSLYS